MSLCILLALLCTIPLTLFGDTSKTLADFKKAIKAGDGALAADLAEELAGTGDARVLETLLKAGLKSELAVVFDRMRRALEGLSDPALAKKIASAAAKGKAEDRALAMELLGGVVGEAVPMVTSRVLSGLRERDRTLKIAAIRASGRLGLAQATKSLQRLGGDGDPAIAFEAKRALAKIQGEAVPSIRFRRILPEELPAKNLMVLIDLADPMFEKPAGGIAVGGDSTVLPDARILDAVAQELRPLLAALPRRAKLKLGVFGRRLKFAGDWQKVNDRIVEERLSWLKKRRREPGRDLAGPLFKALEDENVDALLVVVAGAPDRGEITDLDALRAEFRQRSYRRSLQMCFVSVLGPLDPALSGSRRMQVEAERERFCDFLSDLATGGSFHRASLDAAPLPIAPVTADTSDAFVPKIERGRLTRRSFEAFRSLLETGPEEELLRALDHLAGALGDDRLFRLLLDEGLLHNLPRVADRTRELLGTISEPKRLKEIASELDAERSERRQRALLGLIRELPPQKDLQRALLKAGDARSWAVRLECVRCIQARGNEAGVSALKKILGREQNLRVARATADALALLTGEVQDGFPPVTPGPIVPSRLDTERARIVIDLHEDMDQLFADPGSIHPENATAESGAVISGIGLVQRELSVLLATWDKRTAVGAVSFARKSKKLPLIKQDRKGREELRSWLGGLETAGSERRLLHVLPECLDGVDSVVLIVSGPATDTDRQTYDQALESLRKKIGESGVRIDTVGLFARLGEEELPSYLREARREELAPLRSFLSNLAAESGGIYRELAPAPAGDQPSENLGQ